MFNLKVTISFLLCFSASSCFSLFFTLLSRLKCQHGQFRIYLFYLCCHYFKYNVLKFNISKLKYRPALLGAPCHALLTSYILIGQISILWDRAKVIISVVCSARRE